ncbi:MAG: N-acetyl-gamma-glutamyl-phosphate reductase [Chitinophagaceae bacterium]|nr:N-acetyl-gamma-glutamyl-phosphate reductase [Chitinophagaceae bacterium]
MNRRIKAGIIGGAGYTGGELIRLLINHPHTTVSFINSRSNAGKPVHAIHQDLLGDTDLSFTDRIEEDIDVLFLCLGHGESKKFLAETKLLEKTKIIDLANDFRLKRDARFNSELGGKPNAQRDFIYGLPELNREQIKLAGNIANPGCFATTIQLGLLPLASKGLLKDVYTTGITGSTGAGQSLSQTSHFSWRANNIQAYKTLTHQHLGEIGESLLQLQPASDIELSFVPWRGDFTRGIFVSSIVSCELSLDELYTLYTEFYQSHPFTQVSREAIFLKQVVNTNKAVIQLEKTGDKVVIHSAADNLLKGASGQAVQNMNLLFDLDESCGLRLKPIGF